MKEVSEISAYKEVEVIEKDHLDSVDKGNTLFLNLEWKNVIQKKKISPVLLMYTPWKQKPKCFLLFSEGYK